MSGSKPKKRGLLRQMSRSRFSKSRRSDADESKSESHDGRQVLIQGYLKKKSPKGMKGMKPWQKRYFVLTTSDFGVPQMTYYKDSKMKEARGKIPLEGVTNVNLREKNRLDVNMRQVSRTFSLRAPTEDEAQAWARQIAIVALMIRETLESTTEKKDRAFDTCPDGTMEDREKVEQNQKKLRRQLLRMGYPPYRIMLAVKDHHTLEECVQFLDEQRLSSAAKPVGPSPERRLGALRAQLIRQGYSRGYINMALKRHVTLEGALIYIKNVMSKRQQLYELRGNNGDKSVTRIKSIRDLTHQQNLLIFRKECLFRQTCYLWEDRLDRMENTLVRLSKKLDRCENPTICDCFECIPSKRRTRSLTETDHNLGVLSDLRPLEEKKGEPDGDSTDDEGTERTYTDESGGDDRDSKVDFAAPDQYASGESEGEDEEEKSAVESRTPSQRSDSELKDNSFDSDSRDRDISDDAIS